MFVSIDLPLKKLLLPISCKTHQPKTEEKHRGRFGNRIRVRVYLIKGNPYANVKSLHSFTFLYSNRAKFTDAIFYKGSDFLFFPKLLPLKRENFSHSVSLISVRNTALKTEQNKTRFQEEVTITLDNVCIVKS